MFGALKNAFKSIAEKIKGKDINTETEKKDQEIDKVVETKEAKLKKEVKVSTKTKIKSLFTEKYFLSDNDLNNIIDDLEIKLLQSDLSIEVCDVLLKELKEKIKTEGLKKSNIDEDIKNKFLQIVGQKIKEKYNLEFFKKISFENQKTPFVILFIGTNGTGKTTTISKIAYLLKNLGKKVVLSASDTYRAASIEQLEGHAKNIGVPIIKGKYKQDPASVAFDAVQFAKKNMFDFVLVDSAGRQDNNIGLMEELKKIKKVINPDLTVLTSEALAGQTIIMQAENFNTKVGFDAFVLTKVDVDDKGGTLISIALGLDKPILFLGVGQEYKDLKFFDKTFLSNMFGD